MLITSSQNPRVKQAVALRDRRERDETGLTRVEGYDEIRLALESGMQPTVVFFCPELFRDARGAELLEQVQGTNAEIIQVNRPVFEKIAYRENPDALLAIFPVPTRQLADLVLRQPPLLVVAESVEKPGNLGAILRSADAAGLDAVIVCDPTTDLYTPNVVRSSRGTLFTVPVAEATSADALNWLRERHIAIVATTPNTDMVYTAADLRGPVAIAVGTEDKGLTETWLKEADVSVRIPMQGRINSLNVATATTLLLYEALRQRTSLPSPLSNGERGSKLD